MCRLPSGEDSIVVVVCPPSDSTGREKFEGRSRGERDDGRRFYIRRRSSGLTNTE